MEAADRVEIGFHPGISLIPLGNPPARYAPARRRLSVWDSRGAARRYVRVIGILLILLALWMPGWLPIDRASTPPARFDSVVPATAADPAHYAAAMAPAPAGSGRGFGEWPTYVADAQRSGSNLAERTISVNNASALRVVWSAPIGGAVEDTAVVDHGRVIVSSWDGYEYSFNASNGTLNWKTYIGQTTFAACGYSGPRGTTSTASVVNGTVYVGGGDAQFYAVNESTGHIEWVVSEKSNSPSAGDYNWGSPLVVNSTAYIGLSTACGNPASQGGLVSINLNGTSHRVQHFFPVVPTGQGGGSVWSTPTFDRTTGKVWITTGDEGGASSGYFRSIVALNSSNLSVLGSWQQGTSGVDYDFGAGATVFHDPSGRLLVGATNKNGVFYALNRSNVSSSGSWRPVWQDNVSWYANASIGQPACGCSLAPAAFDGATLYLGGGYARLPNGTNVAGTVRAVNPADGAYLWTHSSPGIVRAAPSYANGLVLDAADANNNLTSVLEVLNATSGATLFTQKVNGTINAGPSIADGHVYFGTANWSGKGGGRLYALGLPVAATIAPASLNLPAGAFANLSATVSGGMPPYSLSWNPGDGGSPTSGPSLGHRFPVGGPYHVVLTVRDNGSSVLTSKANVTVRPAPVSVGEYAAVPAVVQIGNSTALVVRAVGGVSPLAYGYTGLPAGCATADTTILPCTPSQVGNFTVEVRVSDPVGDEAFANATLMVAIRPVALFHVVFFQSSSTVVVLGQPVSLWVVAVGGILPYTYAFGGLPGGCLDDHLAQLTCLPTQAGNFTVQVNVTDSRGTLSAATLPLQVARPSLPSLALLGFFVDPGTVSVGQTFGVRVVSSGGVPPVHYQYSGLPTGCRNATGSGFDCAPQAVGTFSLRVWVNDSAGRSVNGSARLTVGPIPQAGTGKVSSGSPFSAGEFLGVGAVAGVAAGALVAWVFHRRRSPATDSHRPRYPGARERPRTR